MVDPYPKQEYPPPPQPAFYGMQGTQPPAYGVQPTVFGTQPQPYGGQPQPYGGQPQPYGAPPPYGGAYPYGNATGAVPEASDAPQYRRGGPDDPKDDELGRGFGDSFSEKSIRRVFVRKVYLILLCQLSVTLGFIALFVFHKGVKQMVREHMYLYYVSYAIFLITYISLVCCTGLRRKHPWNLIFLSVFTLAMSYMTGTISSFYDTKIVFIAVGICCAYDITGCGLYLFVFSLVVFIFGLVAIFTYNHIIDTVYSALIALLFSLYLAYDTQMLVGGRKYELSPEEHVFGALALYMDVVMIFIALLGLSKSGD